MEVLSYTCDSDLVIVILCIIIHYHIAKVIGATKYEKSIYVSKERLISLHFRYLWCGVWSIGSILGVYVTLR